MRFCVRSVMRPKTSMSCFSWGVSSRLLPGCSKGLPPETKET